MLHAIAPRFRPLARCQAATRAAAAAALLLVSATGNAHDWPSPRIGAVSAASDDGPRERQGPNAPWAGLLWSGPRSGPPPAPSATDCRRAPVPFEVAESPDRQGRTSSPIDRVRPAHPSDSATLSGTREMRTSRAEGASASELTRSMESALAAASPTQPVQPADVAHARPADEQVTAGVVDDNADFGEYLNFRKRNDQVPRREIAIADRVRLDVRDAAGRPVPDAAVAVYAAGHPAPLWARTDASGRAWLMPQPGMSGIGVYEVQVSKSGASTRVVWQRGQKDVLQARLDGAGPQPARLDLVFLIDATGSMADEIDKLKRTMKSVADQIAMLPSKPDVCYGLVAYRDRGDEFFVRGADFTNDLSAFQSTLARLQADGGGDNAEAMNEALHTAVHRLSWRGEGTARLAVLVADAPPHLDYGRPTYDEDVRGALARGIKLFAIGASGLDKQGEFIFRQAAQFTGGRFVFLTYAQAARSNSGPGRETVHDVRNYSVETLDKLIVRLVREELSSWP
jgi:von Willebrand factor type A domain